MYLKGKHECIVAKSLGFTAEHQITKGSVSTLLHSTPHIIFTCHRIINFLLFIVFLSQCMGYMCFDIVSYLYPHAQVLFFKKIKKNFKILFKKIIKKKSFNVVAKGSLLQIKAELLYSFRNVLWFDCQKCSFESHQIL